MCRCRWAMLGSCSSTLRRRYGSTRSRYALFTSRGCAAWRWSPAGWRCGVRVRVEMWTRRDAPAGPACEFSGSSVTIKSSVDCCFVNSVAACLVVCGGRAASWVVYVYIEATELKILFHCCAYQDPLLLGYSVFSLYFLDVKKQDFIKKINFF